MKDEGYHIEQEGRVFPAVEYEGEFVAEAYLHQHDELPHMHANLEELFPRAITAAEEAEGEDVTPCGFEARGQAIGKATTTRTTTTTTMTTTMVDHRAGRKLAEEERVEDERKRHPAVRSSDLTECPT